MFFGRVTECVCGTKFGYFPPFTYQQSGDFSTPSHSSTHLGGKGCQGLVESLRCRKCSSQAGGERCSASPGLCSQALRCWRMQGDTGGCRDQKYHENFVTRGWQLSRWCPSLSQQFPHHFKYILKHNHCTHCIALPWGCAVLLTCTGQSNAALSGKELIPG